jgi:hypothetical protein
MVQPGDICRLTRSLHRLDFLSLASRYAGAIVIVAGYPGPSGSYGSRSIDLVVVDHELGTRRIFACVQDITPLRPDEMPQPDWEPSTIPPFDRRDYESYTSTYGMPIRGRFHHCNCACGWAAVDFNHEDTEPNPVWANKRWNPNWRTPQAALEP